MKTEIVSPDEAASAVTFLRAGEIVALPTETVYGLAADALNPLAVAKIFEAKERPRFNPLIVHLPNEDWLERVAKTDNYSRDPLRRLIAQFWPGPLTIVLDRQPIVPEIVTAGLDTVAVRISAHPVFDEIVREFGAPLAAPSANRFGRVSPTNSRHVLDELNGRIPLIVDAGQTTHGIESTIVALSGEKIEILRRGPITAEQLRGMGFQPVSYRQDADVTKISAPGQLPIHYAPKTPLRLIDEAGSFSPSGAERVALLAWNPVENDGRFVKTLNLSEGKDLREAAANLFSLLRELDALDVDLIVAERVPGHGLGAAILDRLGRAAGSEGPVG